jgi:hypothetical protein
MNAETTAIPSTTPNAPNIIVPSAGGGTNSAKNGYCYRCSGNRCELCSLLLIMPARMG